MFVGDRHLKCTLKSCQCAHKTVLKYLQSAKFFKVRANDYEKAGNENADRRKNTVAAD